MSSVVNLAGDVGPEAALRLKTQLSDLLELSRPSIRVDMSLVRSLHLGAVNGLVVAIHASRRNAGQFHVVSPGDPEPRNLLLMAGLSPWMT